VGRKFGNNQLELTMRTSTVDFAAALALLSEMSDQASVSAAVMTEASKRLLNLRRLLEAALPAVELFGDLKTMQAIRQELWL
jgi:hypothetical protein